MKQHQNNIHTAVKDYVLKNTGIQNLALALEETGATYTISTVKASIPKYDIKVHITGQMEMTILLEETDGMSIFVYAWWTYGAMTDWTGRIAFNALLDMAQDI